MEWCLSAVGAEVRQNKKKQKYFAAQVFQPFCAQATLFINYYFLKSKNASHTLFAALFA